MAELIYWRSTHGHEVDFLIGSKTAIEVKAAERVSSRDCKGLEALREEGVFRNFLLVSQDRVSAAHGAVRAMHWEQFLQDLWEDAFV